MVWAVAGTLQSHAFVGMQNKVLTLRKSWWKQSLKTHTTDCALEEVKRAFVSKLNTQLSDFLGVLTLPSRLQMKWDKWKILATLWM